MRNKSVSSKHQLEEIIHMQKKIIALAIATAFSAPAFADTSIYGVLDVGYANAGKTVNSVKTSEAAFAYSTQTSSRLGFLTSEDLGDGMKAMVKIETGIGSNQMAGFVQTGTGAPKTNGTTIDATSLGNRELWSALVIGDTTIQAGYGSTLVRDITFAYDAALAGNLVGNAITNDAATSSNRVVGATVYQNFGAITGVVQLSSNTDSKDGSVDSKNNGGYLLGLKFNQGPISAAFAYQSLKNVNAQATTTITVPTTTATDTTQKIMIAGGSYDFGVAKAFVEYANIKNDDNVTAAASSKKTFENVGVDVPFTSAFLGFAVLSHGTVNASTTAASQSHSGYAVGGKYSMSKTSYVYASVGENKLDDQAGTTNTGYKVDQYALGLVHTF
jgi:predicted porin